MLAVVAGSVPEFSHFTGHLSRPPRRASSAHVRLLPERKLALTTGGDGLADMGADQELARPARSRAS